MKFTPLNDLLSDAKTPWHYPFLKPYRVRSLGLFAWQFWDCSYYAVPLTKLHRFDLLVMNHRKWWQPWVCGFQIWGRITDEPLPGGGK